MQPDDDEETGFDESEGLGEDDLVTLVSDDGEELVCVVLAVVDHDGRSYAVLTPRAGLESGDDASGELLLATYDEDADGGARFGPVDDVAVVAALQEAIKDLVDVDTGSDAPIFGGPVPEA